MNAPLRTPPAAEVQARPLRVLQVIDNLGMGGAEVWLVELLRHWRETGGSVANDIVVTGGERTVFDDEAAALGAKVHYLRFGRSNVPGFVAGLRRILREGSYDAIHDHQDQASGWHYLMGAGALPPVRVTHVHNPAYQLLNNHGVTWSRRLAGSAGRSLVARYATHIVGTSREAITAWGFDAPVFSRIPKAALHCGFDPRRFQAANGVKAAVRQAFGWPGDIALVLLAGRFDVSPDVGHPQNHKNTGFATDVAIACAKANDRIRFVFAGAFTAATPILRERIDSAGVGDRIAFAGPRKDIERLMTGADALFFPSRAEGLGMVAVEAQAAGLPVLASTGVPRECVVIPELVRFLSLDARIHQWRDTLLELTLGDRLDAAEANRRVSASRFAISHSAHMLTELYRSGVLA